MRVLLLVLLLALGALGQETRSFLAVRTRDGAVIASQDPDRWLVPASAVKLLTAARALALPPRETRLWYADGVLILEGGGDPTLTRADLEGLRSFVTGPVFRVEVDAPDLGLPYGPGWAWEDMVEDFQPEVSGLTLDGGLTPLTVGPQGASLDPATGLEVRWRGGGGELALMSLPGRPGLLVSGRVEEPVTLQVPVPEPELWAGRILARGLPLSRGKARGRLVASALSEPMADVLRRALAVSDNLVMEVLFRQLPPVPQAGRVVDGCGLSRYNLVSARTLVAALSPELLALLPGPGVGTLRNRLEGVPVVAKTGTLGGVSALAGAVHPGTEEEIVFAVLTNGALDVRAAKRWEDDWVRELARRSP